MAAGINQVGATLKVMLRKVSTMAGELCDFISKYKQRYLMPEGINARVSRYYICWHSITIVCYTFVQQLEICN